jgi:hypothetical protein
MNTKYSKEHLLEILALLEDIKARGPHYPDYGICGNLEDDFPEACDFITEYAEGWKHNPHTHSQLPVEGNLRAYLANSYNHTLWSKSTKHGRLRWQLLSYVIKKVRKDIKNA